MDSEHQENITGGGAEGGILIGHLLLRNIILTKVNRNITYLLYIVGTKTK